MMELTINDVVYSFNAGFGFVKAINGMSHMTSNGMTKDNGLQYKVAGLIDGDILDLVDVLDAMNKGQTPRLTKKALEAYIEDPDTDVDELFQKTIDFLSSANCTKKEVQALLEAVKNR